MEHCQVILQSTMHTKASCSEDNVIRLKPAHFYYDNCHYDAIVSATTGKVCTSQPTLSSSQWHNKSYLLVQLS